MSERIVFFLDFANIDHACADKGYNLDYLHLMNYIAEGRFLIDAHCYVPIDPRKEHAADDVIEQLWSSGYVVHTKIGTQKGSTYKCDFDVQITMDILRVAYQIKPDIIVLASGDVDFIPLILELRRNGIRVEVASVENSASREVILKCSGFISLDRYYEGSAVGQGTHDTSAPAADADRRVEPDDEVPAGHDALSRAATLPDAKKA